MFTMQLINYLNYLQKSFVKEEKIKHNNVVFPNAQIIENRTN